MDLKIIRTDDEYNRALARIETLMGAEPGTREFDELEVLALLIETYEAKAHPVDPPSPLDAIRFRMDQAGLRQRDLVALIGSSSKVSEVLSGKRQLSFAMMKALRDGLGIPADVFFGTPQKGGRTQTSPRHV